MEIIKKIFSNILLALTSKRFKSFYWRSGGMVSAEFLNLVAANLSLFHLPGWGVVFAGLVIGELTKALNTFVSNLKIEE